MARSLFSRKLDIVYLIFFIIHIPIIFAVDAYPLYPPSIRPAWMDEIRNFYITTYRDQFFISPPAWFNAYLWMEILYHVPVSVWAIGAILRDDPKLPIHLLVFAVQTGVTTFTCIADYLSWSNFRNEEKIRLGQLYVPYLALAVFMGVDMYRRLDVTLGVKSGGSKKNN
ncbi:hypothetical protein NA57DRAFT_75976 [Rhizodiscina lignyota]|uniref:Efficient mitochondria targeting-associated protein 19 n=1 Tax=Rhizodiscina lignyota TaxID=1504668 RepID=A0A9P4IFK0_9PEZI|nr:hypothetical protein NA57DRAFT_75976 [Rhizodiscina lignyota]